MLREIGIGVLGAIMLSLLFLALYYKKAYESMSFELQLKKVELETLSAELKAKELKLKAYLREKPKIEEKIIAKYKITKQNDGSCQSFKEGVNAILDVFYSHPPP